MTDRGAEPKKPHPSLVFLWALGAAIAALCVWAFIGTVLRHAHVKERTLHEEWFCGVTPAEYVLAFVAALLSVLTARKLYLGDKRSEA